MVDILGLLRKIVVEEIKHRVDAYHISDIVVAYKDDRERQNVELVLSVEHQLFKRVGKYRKPYERVDPHRVALLTYRIRREGVKHGKGYNGKLVYLARVLVKIKSKGKTAKSRFEKDYSKYSLLDPVLREERDYI